MSLDEVSHTISLTFLFLNSGRLQNEIKARNKRLSISKKYNIGLLVRNIFQFMFCLLGFSRRIMGF